MRPNDDHRVRGADEHVKAWNVTRLIPRTRVEPTLKGPHKAPSEPPPDNDPGPSAA